MACSPTLERWEKYRLDPIAEKELLDMSFVRCLSANGEVVYTWQAPSPFESFLSLGASGEVFVVANDRL